MTNLVNLTDKFPLTNKTIKVGKIPVEIKCYLSTDEFFNAVHTVADNCFVEDEKTHEIIFRPEYRDIAWRYMVLKFFTDIDISAASVDEVFKVTQSDWYIEIERVCAENSIYSEIGKAADAVISAQRKSAFDKLCDNLSAILKTDLTGNLADVKDVLDKLENVDKEAFVKAVVDQNIEKNKK